MAVRKGTDEEIPAKNASDSARGGRKGKSPGKKAKVSYGILFWLAFAIFIFGLFLFNKNTISDSIQTVQNEMAARKNPQALPMSEPPVESADSAFDSEEAVSPEQPAEVQPTAVQPTAQPVTAPQQAPASQPSQQQPSPQQPAVQAPAPKPAPVQPAAGQSARTAAQPAPQKAPPPTEQGQDAVRSTVELRDRALYFTEVDRGGSILRVKVSRKFPVSDTPMTDVIQALIAGPSTEEKSRGLISLIPSGTKILSAAVRGDTAYISFSEDFQYNAYGVEGYAGQLRQIVYTATEFPNVKNVQILIEGRKVDYLGEGIWIGGPLTRDML